MNTFLRNIPVYIVFSSLATFAWLFGGSRADMLVSVAPWLWAFLLEILLLMPQMRPYESATAARMRMWHSLKRDPVLYLSLFFIVLLVLPLMNVGLCPGCDHAAIAAGANPKPPMPWLPFCVNIHEHYGVLQWFVPVFTALLVCRNALTRSGKRLLMEMIVWNGAALAVFGFIQYGLGAPSPLWEVEDFNNTYFFSTFGYPNMGGAFFTMMFAFSIGIWQMRVMEVEDLPPLEKTRSEFEQRLVRILRAHYPLVAAVLNMFAAIFTLCRAAILLSGCVFVLAFLYYFLRLVFSRHQRAKCVKKAAALCIGVVVMFMMVFIFAPKDFMAEVDTVSSTAILQRVSGKGQYHVRVATEVFKAYPVFGVGGWGYKHFCISYMTEDELKQIQQVGGINVHNDYLQFLAEHGLAGGLTLFAIMLFLLVPLFKRWLALYQVARFIKTKDAPPSPRALYSIPAATFWILMGNVALFVHCFGDCVLRSVAVLSTMFISLAAADGFLPREDNENEEDSKA